MENLPMRPFDPTNFFLQPCWPPTSLFDSTNVPKLFGLPFPMPPPSMMAGQADRTLIGDKDGDSKNGDKNDKTINKEPTKEKKGK